MIRVLVMIAVAGFILSVATLSAAIAIGGPEALSHAAWTWGANRHWDRHWSHEGWDGTAARKPPARWPGPAATAWKSMCPPRFATLRAPARPS
jgi:hypothetical protein